MATTTPTRRARPADLPLKTPGQLKAIASPSRLELISFLAALGPCSVAELAEAMDRPADALYRHLRILLKAGLAVKVGHRPAGRRREVILDAAADHFTLDYDPATKKNAAAHRRLARAILRETERSLRAVDGAADVHPVGPHKNLLLRFEIAWLTDEDRARAVEALETLQQLFLRNQRREPDRRLFILTSVLAPVVRTRHARVRQPAAAATPRRRTHGGAGDD